MPRLLLCATLALVLGGCASVPPPGSADEASSRNRDLISAQEIRDLPTTTGWDLVSRLRPQWLRARGPGSLRGAGPEEPVVYFDEIRVGGLQMLQQISSLVIAEIRFVSGRDATTLHGLDHGAGAIMVRTRR